MIPLYGANASGNSLLSLDDPTVDTDQGVAFTPRVLSAAFDSGPAGGWASLRRLTQAVSLTGSATVVVTPWGDGSEYTGQAYTQTLSAVNGGDQLIEAPVFVAGTRFQMGIAITAHAGKTELGESDQWFVGRRTVRGS